MFVERVAGTLDAGQRLLSYSGTFVAPPCHTFASEVTAAGCRLDGLGPAIDVGDVQRLPRRWIDEQRDHALPRNDRDDVPIDAVAAAPEGSRTSFRMPPARRR